jgi:hypothetical protein
MPKGEGRAFTRETGPDAGTTVRVIRVRDPATGAYWDKWFTGKNPKAAADKARAWREQPGDSAPSKKHDKTVAVTIESYLRWHAAQVGTNKTRPHTVETLGYTARKIKGDPIAAVPVQSLTKQHVDEMIRRLQGGDNLVLLRASGSQPAVTGRREGCRRRPRRQERRPKERQSFR